jgi:F1F0 ATPase subunit 2
MTDLLTALAPHGLAVDLPAGLAVGTLLGLVHFGSLWWNVRLLTTGSAVCALAVQLLRFAILAGVLFGLAMLGAAALLAGTLGLLLARALLLRRLGTTR